jgi:lysyl-tRNA synthetase class I
MNEYLNAANLALAVSLALAFERVLRAVAPITKTEFDDNLVREIDKAREWARDKAPVFYTVVEQAQEIGKILSKDKTKAFDAGIAQAFEATHGKPLPVQALREAQIVAMGLAASDKLGNPPKAPSN